MKPATEILLSAAFALTPKEHWTISALARDEWGRAVGEASPEAVKWCVVGALYACDDEKHAIEAVEILGRAIGGGVVDFNNTGTHAKVLAALYKAAELSEADNG